MSATKGKKRVTFALEADPHCKVSVAGSFNGWEPVELTATEQNGTARFEKRVYLPEGRHEYKFMIDGDWTIDPNCSEWTPNEFGTLNSVKHVGT